MSRDKKAYYNRFSKFLEKGKVKIEQVEVLAKNLGSKDARKGIKKAIKHHTKKCLAL